MYTLFRFKFNADYDLFETFYDHEEKPWES